MRVLTPSYTGDITLAVRDHAAGDYWLCVIDEETRTYSAYTIDSAGTTYDGFDLEFPVSLSIEDGKNYDCRMFRQDGTLADASGSLDALNENIWNYFNAGKIIAQVVRFHVLCTAQTDLPYFTTGHGIYEQYDTGANEYVTVSDG